MTDAQSALAQVREALKAGPTRGNWVVAPKMTMPSIVCAVNNVEVCPADHRDPSHQDVDAAYIAAANPANIAAILAHEREQAAEIKRLRKLAMSTHLFEEAPCFICGYNGPGYYQPEQHPCAALYHEAMEEQR